MKTTDCCFAALLPVSRPAAGHFDESKLNENAGFYFWFTICGFIPNRAIQAHGYAPK
jgi:hypothetical protein